MCVEMAGPDRQQAVRLLRQRATEFGCSPIESASRARYSGEDRVSKNILIQQANFAVKTWPDPGQRERVGGKGGSRYPRPAHSGPVREQRSC
jgi:hypothetical protein